ncbi:LysR family transcriptional regulator [Sphingopyxis sp. GW247-27LB]|uniref:LysR family transcriptional regulator n=1 Tax=Sphingopyxis sp. GW247-27LB TaxID=2012632 RepID=UPI000BA6E831|nr:LysR substrate-binding domain-containing protein [Sphingopyxis sp. GW247-27LB]PAL21472.1 LuxR family transcriptional regulator [Sphingopyxis sp. GW247-27LB]
MLDPRLLRAFVAIIDTGSFTLAADRLHSTQSTISQQLARLEQAIGQALVDRAARPVRATASGDRLLGYARRILALQQEAETLLSDRAGTAAIRIGVPDDILTLPMGELFARFAEAHREVRLDVTTGLSRDLERRFRAGEFDIVVVKEVTASADSRASFPEAIGWFESARRARPWSEPVPLVTFPPGGLYREAMFDRIERERRHWYVAFTATSLASILTAVEAGLGLSLLPRGAVDRDGIRPYAGFGEEAPLVVSAYSWESSGLIGWLLDHIGSVLSDRHAAHRARLGV